MVTYGFYNSVDHDRTYDAMQVSELFDGLIREGVYEFIGERFMVRALSGFQVSVGTGRAWYKHTWTKNDATLVLTLPAPPTLPDRYRSDAIVLDINSDIKVRENKITYIKGEESADSNPPHPTLASGTHHQVPLAYIKRVGREEEILQTNINYVVGQSPCPFVVSVIEQIDITDQVAQWNNAWDEWFSNKQGIVETDISNFESVVSSATTEVNNDKAAFKAYVTEQVSEFTIWMSDKKDSFDTWFANLQYILDGDVAGNLQNEIDDLKGIVPISRGGTGNDKGYIRTGNISNTNNGDYSTCEGAGTIAEGISAHAEGGGTVTGTRTIGGGLSRYTETFGSDFTTISNVSNPSSVLVPMPSSSVANNKLAKSYGGYDDITPGIYSFGITIKKKNSDTYLHRQIWTIGRNAIDRSDYTGQLSTKPADHTSYEDYSLAFDEITSSVVYENDDFKIILLNKAPNDSSNIGKIIDIKYSTGSNSWGIGRLGLQFKRTVTENYDIEVYYDLPVYEQKPSYVYFKPFNTLPVVSGYTSAYGDNSHAEGRGSAAIGVASHAENSATANADYSHAEGSGVTGNDAIYSHAEGNSSEAKGSYSHAEGYGSFANKICSHAEGKNTVANGDYSHVEGFGSQAIGNYSHAEGQQSFAYGVNSHAGGGGTAYEDYQFVHGGFGIQTKSPVGKITSPTVIDLENGDYCNGICRMIEFSSSSYTDPVKIGYDSTEETTENINSISQAVWLLTIIEDTGRTLNSGVGMYIVMGTRTFPIKDLTMVGWNLTIGTGAHAPKAKKYLIFTRKSASATLTPLRIQMVRIM